MHFTCIIRPGLLWWVSLMIIIRDIFHTICQLAGQVCCQKSISLSSVWTCFTLCVDTPSSLFTMRNQSHDDHYELTHFTCVSRPSLLWWVSVPIIIINVFQTVCQQAKFAVKEVNLTIIIMNMFHTLCRQTKFTVHYEESISWSLLLWINSFHQCQQAELAVRSQSDNHHYEPVSRCVSTGQVSCSLWGINLMIIITLNELISPVSAGGIGCQESVWQSSLWTCFPLCVNRPSILFVMRSPWTRCWCRSWFASTGSSALCASPCRTSARLSRGWLSCPLSLRMFLTAWWSARSVPQGN